MHSESHAQTKSFEIEIPASVFRLRLIVAYDAFRQSRESLCAKMWCKKVIAENTCIDQRTGLSIFSFDTPVLDKAKHHHNPYKVSATLPHVSA